jgi:hypothetical protein
MIGIYQNILTLKIIYFQIEGNRILETHVREGIETISEGRMSEITCAFEREVFEFQFAFFNRLKSSSG